MQALSDAVPVTSVTVSSRAGVWTVAVDGAFLGDYSRKPWAIEAALQKGGEIAASGRPVQVVLALAGNEVAKVLLDGSREETVRPPARR